MLPCELRSEAGWQDTGGELVLYRVYHYPREGGQGQEAGQESHDEEPYDHLQAVQEE